MQFPTMTFAIFFVLVFAAGSLLRPHIRRWKVLLLASSWVFYSWWDVRFAALLGASIALNHCAVTATKRWEGQQNLIVSLGITANLLLLGFFKYYGFFRGVSPSVWLAPLASLLPFPSGRWFFQSGSPSSRLRRLPT